MEYTYAALLLHKVSKDINEANLKAVISATGVSVDEAKVKVMVASLSGVDIASKLANASVAAAPAAAAPVVEEKKKEEPKVDSAAGLASLFG
ncbi:MAG: 50S ribosomal protein L12 [archaeon]